MPVVDDFRIDVNPNGGLARRGSLIAIKPDDLVNPDFIARTNYEEIMRIIELIEVSQVSPVIL